MRVKEESEKAGSKMNIQKVKIMASGPITSWQVEGEKMETVTDFIFLDSRIIADGDCSHEIKRCLLLGSKVVTNLDNILKSRDITLPTSDGTGCHNIGRSNVEFQANFFTFLFHPHQKTF